ncbi:rho GTPase-activating protein 28 isoform X1 [Megalops cyprinoides]|uniref:rho GTPase-activating protein 28 isoform X1 n=2 Tax=Megalops cyprinoides TaxID=118141 RepID=UPI001864D540|nr:rho GTPase-activating protein 28 isoform X1 [Megalops cyprinoides]
MHRKVRYQGLDRMTSPEAQRPPPTERSVSQDSQDSLDCGSMEDYWSEMKSIEESGHGGYEELERRSSDEAELEEAWLQEAGLSTLVSGAPGDGPTEAILSTLTRSQAALVRKRLDNYTQTLRKRNKQPIRHVRDVFSSVDAPSIPAKEQIAPVSPISPISPKTQRPSKLPIWMPVKGESRVPDCEPSRDTLSSEVPYSEGAAAHRKGKDCLDCQRVRRDDRTAQTIQPFRPKLGLTKVRDLSSEDMKKISCISLIELSTFYDCLGIELKRNRTVRSKARESGIFGVPLATLLENDQKLIPGSKVPLVFRKILSKLEQTGLQTEGILRVPGSASRVKHLRQELESKFYEDRFDWDQVRHNDASGLLKMFIRELPCPLLTHQHLPAFVAVQKISLFKHQIQALHLLIMLLPEPNRDTLKALLEFLRKVVANEDKNRMSLWNVSMIVAPNLFISRGKSTKLEEMQGAPGSAQLVRLLITHQDLLWTVPSFLISQVRKMNEAPVSKKTPGSEKTKRRLLRRRNAERDKGERSEVSDLREGVIRVHAPLHAKVSMAIQLDSETKAKDVMARFDCETRGSRSSSKRQRQYLFEVGGNIGERCLDPETHLLDLYRVNPTCEWIFKPRTT